MLSAYKKAGSLLKDFIAPKHCIICNEYTGIKQGYSNFMCNKCHDRMPFSSNKDLVLNKFYQNAEHGNIYVDEATALISLKDNRNYLNIIYSLKYQYFKSIAKETGGLLAEKIISDKMLNYDYIIPLPIHIAKKRERGFNQSDLIAYEISLLTGISFNDKILYRSKYTVTQTALNKEERYLNMQNVFSLKKHAEIQSKSLLLIDDVLTTGSTLNSAAEILKKVGAAKVGTAVVVNAD